MDREPLTIALVGNPNAGKSTLFNALSGLRQHVANYPGVTVEMKHGSFTANGRRINIIDLPGTYSLAPRSPDEMVAVDLLLGRRPEDPAPDVIVSIVDASNIDRHLYLTTQLLELGPPVVLAVNMIDVAESQGIRIDTAKLAEQSGLRVVCIQANKSLGLEELKSAILTAADNATDKPIRILPGAIEAEIATIRQGMEAELPEFLARRVVLDVGGYTEQWLVQKHGPAFLERLQQSRERLTQQGFPIPVAEAKARYQWIRQMTSAAVSRPAVRPVTWTDRIDRVLTHRLWGTLVFLLLMFLMFQSIFFWAKPAMDVIDAFFSSLSSQVSEALPPGPVRGLLADGVVTGVGSVLIFLPQIVILFGFIAVLEDCGYMARAAFLMDRLMSRCGLSGKSFIPMLSSVACAVPGIMATRVIENPRDRLATILVAPLMSCSARLPVYLLFIAAFFRDGYAFWVPGLVLFGMYLVGFITAPLVALLLKRTLLRGATPMFVMELPSYKRPSLAIVFRRMIDAGWAFVYRAGTLILASMIIVWALLYFPHRDATGESYEARMTPIEERLAEVTKTIEETKDKSGEVPEALTQEEESLTREINRINGDWKRASYLGQAGQTLEPIFRPLGWDWKLGMAAIASFPAREVMVGTIGLIYNVGEIDADAASDEEDASGSTLRGELRGEWSQDPIRGAYAPVVALSIMVFIALCCQCVSTLAVIRRETKSWFWTVFTFVYMTVLAYVGALVTFQVGRAIMNLWAG